VDAVATAVANEKSHARPAKVSTRPKTFPASLESCLPDASRAEHWSSEIAITTLAGIVAQDFAAADAVIATPRRRREAA
jgi:hypothetical protein